MPYVKQVMSMAFLVGSLIWAAGCQLAAPPQITLDIEPVEPRGPKKEQTVPIVVRRFIDARSNCLKDQIGHYGWGTCSLNDFEGTLTRAFSDSLKSHGATVATVEENGSPVLTLTGEIESFFILWQQTAVYVPSRDVGTQIAVRNMPLRVKLALSDPHGQIIWQSAVSGSVSDNDLFWDSAWSAGDCMKKTTKKCVRRAVEELLSDDSFWCAVARDKSATSKP